MTDALEPTTAEVVVGELRNHATRRSGSRVFRTSLEARSEVEKKTALVSFSHENHHDDDEHQGLGHLARSVSTVTAALAKVSLVSRLFSFLVDCSGMILKGFGCVAFFAGVKASSFCIHLSCLVCIQSVVCGVWSHLFYGL